MIHTTTYIHIHDGDEITVDPRADSRPSGRTAIDFGSSGEDAQVVVFLDVTVAQELAASILAAFPLPVAAVEPCRYDAPCSKCVAHNNARIAEHVAARPALGAALAADAHRSAELAALRAELTGPPVGRGLPRSLPAPTLITIVDHTHQCRDCRAEVDCDGDPCVFDGSCDACS